MFYSKEQIDQHRAEIQEALLKIHTRLTNVERFTPGQPVQMTQADYAVLKANADLGQQVRRMAVGTDLACTPMGWHLCESKSDTVIAFGDTPERALTVAGITP